MLTHPALRFAGFSMLILGVLNASVYPYQSLIAIEKVGLSEPAFAMVLVFASVIAVCSAVVIGIIGDQTGKRELVAVLTACAGAAGILAMLFFPGPITVVICHGIMLPILSSLYGQIFALARLASPTEAAPRDAILAVIRAAMSISFLAMLIYWTWAFGIGAPVMGVYVSGALASLALFVLLRFYWPRAESKAWADVPSGLNMRSALAEIARPHVLVRLLLLGAIASPLILYFVLVSLIFEASPIRGTSDVALYVGLVAGWEVPCLLLLPRFLGRFPRSNVIAISATIYTSHLLLMPFWVDTHWLWLGTLIAGVAGTAVISVPISYYQDLLRDRPGTASAMLALQKLVSDILCASAFAFGTLIGGYLTVAVIGAVLTICGALGIYLADRHRWLMPPEDASAPLNSSD
jgi:SET family sugar efflux transporter-like MFS transporter